MTLNSAGLEILVPKLKEMKLSLSNKAKFSLTYAYSCYLGSLHTWCSRNQLARRGIIALSVVIDHGNRRRFGFYYTTTVGGNMCGNQETLLSDEAQTFHE